MSKVCVLVIALVSLTNCANANYDKYYLDDSTFCRKATNSVPIGHQSYMSTIVVMAVQPSNSYRPSLRCTLTARAPNGFGIIVAKRSVICILH